MAIYEDIPEACGIVYAGAHQMGRCIVLWDRAPALEVVAAEGERDWSLQEDGIWERVASEYESPTRAMVKITTPQCPRCRQLNLR